MLNFWNLPKMLRPKIWPKEGQKFSKSKIFEILSEDKKNYRKMSTFCQNKQKITSLVYFLAFEGHLSQKKSTNKETKPFFVCFSKNWLFCYNFSYPHLKI